MENTITHKIEVILNKDEQWYPETPYFCCIFGYHGDWCNDGCGWSETPEKAFSDAYMYYKSYPIV